MENPYRHPKFTMWLTLAIAVIVVLTVAGTRLFFTGTDQGLAVVALVGPADGQSSSILEAASTLALEDWTELHGKPPVEVRYFPYQDYPGETFGTLRALQANGRLAAIIGGINPETTRVWANFAQEMEVPHLSVFIDAEPWFEDYPFSFSLRSQTEHLPTAAAAFLVQQEITSGLAIVSGDSTVPSLASGLVAALPADAVIHHLESRDMQPESDLLAELAELVNLDAVILELPLAMIVSMIEAIQAWDPNVTVVTIPETLPRTEELADPRLEGIWMLLPWYGGRAVQEATRQYDFRETMLAESGQPDADVQGYPVYDGVQLLLEVMSRTGTVPRSMRDEMAVYEGDHLSGRLTFTTAGLPDENMYQAWQVHRGVLHPASNEPMN